MTVSTSPTMPRLAHYPGASVAIAEMIGAIRAALACDSILLGDVVRRETHAATGAEIERLFDAACDEIVAKTPKYEQQWTLERIKLIRESALRIATENTAPSDEIAQDMSSCMLTIMRSTNEPLHEHALAVGAFSARIAQAMGLDEQTVSDASMAGRLCDVGKLALPRSIMNLDRPLTDDERATIRRHVDVGASMLRGVPRLARYADYVLAHHERLDGSGYPYGLVGDAIPLVSRIVAVADTFHAMSAPRPYRAGIDPDVVVQHLKDESGRLYEPDAVRAMASLLGPRRLVA